MLNSETTKAMITLKRSLTENDEPTTFMEMPMVADPSMASPRRIARAAPSDAAVDTPNVNGLTSGLRRTACIIIPAAPRLIPVNIIRTSLGSLPLYTNV